MSFLPRPGWQVETTIGSTAVWILEHADYLILATPTAAPAADLVRRTLTVDGAGLPEVALALEGEPVLGPLAVVMFGDESCQILRVTATATGHVVGADLVVESFDDHEDITLDDHRPHREGPYTSGVRIHRNSEAHAPDLERRHQLEPTADGHGFRLIALDIDRPASVPLPLPESSGAHEVTALADGTRTTGKRCPHHHFNHPEARYCVQCGRGFDQGVSEVLVEAPRPPLGILVDGHGRRIEVDGPLVLGRRPDRAPEVVDGSMPVRVDVEDASRRHLLVVPDLWDVVVTDVSRNGTYRRVGDGWTRLPPNTRTVLTPGDRLRIGQTTAAIAMWRYLSHHIENAP